MKKIDKEQYLINKLTSKHIGDDAAVIGNMLYSMDTFFEDVHFKRSWMNMTQIGKKAMLVNLSDAIAMNAEPKYALVSVSLPKNIENKEIDELMKSLEDTAKLYGCEIIGGDTIGADKLHLSIAVISQSFHPLLRKGLREGDLLAFTGTLGQSKHDLEILLRGEKISSDSKFYEPKLRVEFIKKSHPYLHAGMDISDGLFCDTNKLLDTNGYGFELLLDIDQEMGLSGEEYEMLVGFSPENLETVLAIAKETDTALTVFAKVVQNDKRFCCESHHFKN
ncbi:MAG TPA: thiamine-phosphate kinase [Sulfurovum sp. UBA12169]|nr:MAG TPA: thiamine-phosphate kinase [Sulfurovum sp. UBA12169]